MFKAFAKQFKLTPDDLDMHVIYDVSHNIAKMEQHYIDGKLKHLLVHRKVGIIKEMKFLQLLIKGFYLYFENII